MSPTGRVEEAGMAARRLAARGRAAPELAWERYDRIALWTTWSPQILGVDADAERISPGVTGTVRALGGVPVPFTITEVDRPGWTWTWVAQLGPVSMTLTHRVRAEARGSATGLLLEGPDPVLLAYAPLAWVALRRLVAR